MRALLVLVATLLWTHTAVADRRVALVVGNSNYAHVTALKNPANDAGAIAALLRDLGFSVRLETDLGIDQFRRVVREFGEHAAGADIAAIYFAGHGLEVDKVNYLIPVDARLTSDRDLAFETVPLDLVLTAVESARGLRVILLDACRDNPFRAMKLARATRSVGRGLAAVEPVTGTLVGYAAREGTTAADGSGKHSPFTQALLDLAPEPGVEISFLFRRVRDRVLQMTGGQQEPYVYGSLPGREIFLKPVSDDARMQVSGLAAQLKAAEAARSEAEAEARAARSEKERALAALRDREQEASAVRNAASVTGSNEAALRAELARVESAKQEALAQARAKTELETRLRQTEAARAQAEATARQLLEHGIETRLSKAPSGQERQSAVDVAFALGVAAEDRRDLNDALRWLTRAAEAGHISAMMRLASIYNDAPGIRNPGESRRWLTRAAEGGSPDAAFRLGKAYEADGEAGHQAEAVKWYRKAAEAGHGDGMNNLATMLASGIGTARDERAAHEWYRRASEKQHTVAMFNLAAMLDDGRSVKKDGQEAAALILKAVRLKDASVFRAVTSNPRAWSRDFVSALQRALVREGRYRGKIDGVLARPTIEALESVLNG